jgi:hypothetical protein
MLSFRRPLLAGVTIGDRGSALLSHFGKLIQSTVPFGRIPKDPPRMRIIFIGGIDGHNYSPMKSDNDRS